MQAHSQRFDLLDGIRGIAALAVMIHHYTEHNGLHWFAGAWVSVDLFFILSGFVIAHSYGRKILGGMSFQRFALVRLTRLGPLYLLGLALGAVAALMALSSQATPTVTADQVLTALLLGLACLPYLNNGYWAFGNETIEGSIFPLNDPAWSLFFELFVNVLFFWFVTRCRTVSSKKIVLISAAAFLGLTVAFRAINPGWGTANFALGFPRVTAAFFAGALIYSMGLHRRRFHPGLGLAVGLACLASFSFADPKLALANSITLVPLCVILLSSAQAEGWSRGVCKALGELSYPLYIVHFPVHRLLSEIPSVRQLEPRPQTLLLSAVAVAVAIAFALVDRRVRQGLQRRWVQG